MILGIIVFAHDRPWFTASSWQSIPWWAWLGGLLGAFNITLSIFLAAKLGALTLAISLVCGQIIASIVLDHFGWLGYPQISISPERMIGALCVIVGLFLVSKS